MDDCPIAKLAARATLDRTALSLIEEALRRGCLPRFAPHDDYDPAALLDALLAARRGVQTSCANVERSALPSDPAGLTAPLRAPAPVSDALPTVTEEPAHAALDDRIVTRIERALHDAGDVGLTRTAIRDALGRNARSGQILTALHLLQVNGMATCETVKTGGRPVEVWRRAK
jgi:hypothetical protein